VKDIFIKDIKSNKVVEISLMMKKKLYEEDNSTVAYIGDKTGDIKAIIKDKENPLVVGDVILAKGIQDANNVFIVSNFKKQKKFQIQDYLPSVNKPIENIIKELEEISKEEFVSIEARTLNEYFFSNVEFLERFSMGIGGLIQHHAYLGGLAEHTLNVTYLARALAYRYDCRNKEIAILAAKLHDIGKVHEYSVTGPFSVTMRGEMEGHIVIGVSMLEEAFKLGEAIYSEEFKNRIRGCLVQHHGKLEFGSPKSPNTEEAFIVHYADYVDAVMNKIGKVKDTTEVGSWSEYDRKIGTRLFV
jgi:3'-5' exoribonuclease